MSCIGKMRREAVYEAFCKALNNTLSVEETMRMVTKAPAPRFYVDFELARKQVSLIERKGPEVLKMSSKRELYCELHRRWRAAGGGSYESLLRIIEEPAPSFYLSHETVKRIVYREIRERRKRRYAKKTES